MIQRGAAEAAPLLMSGPGRPPPATAPQRPARPWRRRPGRGCDRSRPSGRPAPGPAHFGPSPLPARSACGVSKVRSHRFISARRCLRRRGRVDRRRTEEPVGPLFGELPRAGEYDRHLQVPHREPAQHVGQPGAATWLRPEEIRVVTLDHDRSPRTRPGVASGRPIFRPKARSRGWRATCALRRQPPDHQDAIVAGRECSAFGRHRPLANFQPYFSRRPAARPGGTRAPAPSRPGPAVAAFSVEVAPGPPRHRDPLAPAAGAPEMAAFGRRGRPSVSPT